MRRQIALIVLPILLLIGSLGLFVYGVDRFANTALQLSPTPHVTADAIVALTGGSQRVGDGVKLLAESRGRRLLITGAHPATGRAELAKATNEPRALIDCCVDIDYQALNTSGNASETAKWARQHSFSSLIIVTSNYHMPRTLLLLRDEMPGITLHPYPVASPRVHLERWWAHPGSARLLISEYGKYITASLQQIF